MHRPSPLSTVFASYLPDDDLGAPLAVLAQRGISTDVDLVYAPESLPPDPSLPPELYALLRSYAAANVSAPSTNAATLWSRAAPPSYLSTSLPSLDHFLGGYPERSLIELVGTPSSGRTILALYAALVYLLANPQGRVAYLDSTASFDPFRCLSILKQVLIPRARRREHGDGKELGTKPDDNDVAMDVLDRISVSRISTSGQALDKISDDLSKDTTTTLGVVVIDQVDHLLGGDALSTTKLAQGHANLIAFMRRLSSLAKSAASPLTIFLINSLVPSSSLREGGGRGGPASSTSTTATNPAVHLVASNPQPPPVSSVPVLSSFAGAPRGGGGAFVAVANALSPASSESWPNLVDLSLVCLNYRDVVSTRGGGGGRGHHHDELGQGGGGGGDGGGYRTGGPASSHRVGSTPLSTATTTTTTQRRKETMSSIVEIGKNSKGVGGTGQLFGIRVEDGIKLSEI